LGGGDYHGLFCHKRIEGPRAFLDTLAAAVTVIGKSNNRRTEFLAVDRDVEEGKKTSIGVEAY